MTRQIVAVLALLAAPALAESQSPPPSRPPALGPIGLPLAPIGLPLPSIGLPLPAIGLQPPASPSRGGPQHRPDRPGPGGRGRLHSPTVVYFGSFAPWQYEPPSSSDPIERPLPPPAPVTGRLRLELEPADAVQLFVDDEYVGTLLDVGAELELLPGTRHLEVRAPGYETLVFNARIVEHRTITYRGALKSLAARAVAPQPQAAANVPANTDTSRRQTFYLIPGCYMGNVPPHEVKLPANCDLSRMITYTP